MKALIVVDVQNDFVDGSLAVPGAKDVVREIDKIACGDYPLVVASRDWHPPDHFSFSDEPEFRDGSWPAHCVQGSYGADLHVDLPPCAGDAVVSKGTDPKVEAYSAFDGQLTGGTTLRVLLESCGVTEVDVVGLALDYCVKATALDAVAAGFKTRVLARATAAVSDAGADDALREFSRAGVTVA